MTQTFIRTYQAFTSPWKLFNKLMQRYDVPFGQLSSTSTIQLRVGITLKYWIENSFTDFDHEVNFYFLFLFLFLFVYFR